MVYLNADGRASLGTVIASTVVASTAVGLRLLAKHYTTTKWAIDDSWTICSLLGMFAWMGVIIWSLDEGGGGANLSTIEDPRMSQTSSKALYATSPIYAFTSITAKLSILYLYRRLFPVDPFRRITSVMAIVCAILGVAAIVTVLIPCRPVRKYWQPQTPGSCYNFDQVTLGFSTIDIIMDAITLALPIKVILGLQMSRRKKIMLCFVFLLGGFVVLTGIVRLVLSYEPQIIKPNRHMFDQSQGQIWTNIHLGTAILCASLPTFPPLLSHFVAFCNNTASRFSSLLLTSRKVEKTVSQKGKINNNCNTYSQPDDSASDKRFLAEAIAIRSESWSTESRLEMNRVVARDTIDVV